MNKKSLHIILLTVLMATSVSALAQISMPDTVCVGTTRRYKVNEASVPSTYTWKVDGVLQSATKNEINITWRKTGRFLITVQEHSAEGCDGEVRSGYVYVRTVPGVRYPAVTTTSNAAEQLLARDMGIGSLYAWTPSAGLNFSNVRNPIFKYDRSTEYLIRITPPNSCTVVDTLLVFVRSSPSLKSSLYVPTAWTPNNDGHNDKLIPLVTNVRQLHFRIFNRWGQLVFQTSKQGEGWNGSLGGKPQPSGVYVWFIEAEGKDGTYFKLNGTSVLIR